MRDIYAHTTVRRLAAALDSRQADRRDLRRGAGGGPEPPRLCADRRGATGVLCRRRRSSASPRCRRASPSPTPPSRSPWALLGARRTRRRRLGSSASTCSPIAAKWPLIGRARPTTIKLWSVAYFRFWVARRLITLAPGLSVRRRAAVQPVPALPRRQDRRPRGDRDRRGSGRRRPVRGRRGRRGRPPRDGAGLWRGRADACISAPIRIGKGAYVGEASVLDHRHRDSAISPSSATPRRCSAASACPTASAITARRPRRRTPTSASSTN